LPADEIDPAGWRGPPVSGGEDCDDHDPTELPGLWWYADVELDHSGNGLSGTECTRSAVTDVADKTDCDDLNSAAFQGGDPGGWAGAIYLKDAVSSTLRHNTFVDDT
jgi:hypothetical protein